MCGMLNFRKLLQKNLLFTDQSLRNKIQVFRDESETKKALHLTMITTYGVKKNMYSNSVQSQVVLDDLFV